MTINGPNAQNGQPTDTQSRQPLTPGTQIDHYVIHSVLGAGGFGITYLASHDLLGRLYAIKEYFPDEFSFREGVQPGQTKTTITTDFAELDAKGFSNLFNA